MSQHAVRTMNVPDTRKTRTHIAAIAEHRFEGFEIRRLREDYFSQGCVIVREAIETSLLDEMRARFRGLFASVLEREGVAFDADSDIDTLHRAAVDAIGEDRARHFITMGRDFPAFLDLISSPNLLTLLRGLFETQDLQTIADSNIFRVDRPSSSRTNLDWHQDYPYNMLCMNAATAWIPIMPVTDDMGRLHVYPGTAELLPIEYDPEVKKQFHNSRYIAIKDYETHAQEWDREALVIPDLMPGDLLLLHALCLHKSGDNRSSRSRWVATARYGPFMDEALYQRTWFTVRAKYPDIFKDHHPDLFSVKGAENTPKSGDADEGSHRS